MRPTPLLAAFSFVARTAAGSISTASTRFPAEPRRRVLAGAERHAGIELDDDLAALRPVPPPRRPDHDRAPDAQRAEVALPRVRPRRVADRARAQWAYDAVGQRAVLVGGGDGRLDADAGGRVPAQQIGCRLRRLLPDGDGQLQIVHGMA